MQKVVGFFFGGLNAASTLSVIVVVIYGAYLTIHGSMTPGALTSFILYSLTGKPLSFIASKWKHWYILLVRDASILNELYTRY